MRPSRTTGPVTVSRRRTMQAPVARRMWPSVTLVLLLMLCVALGACAGPIGAIRADPKVVQADIARSATSTGDPSWATRNVLYENGLFDLFDDRPEDALAQMHKLMMATQGDPDILFALAELSYIYGRSAA